MEPKVKTRKMGKLRIFLKSGEMIKGDKLLHRLFPKSKYRKIMEEAKNSGILQAHIYHTHAAYESGSNIAHFSADGDNGRLTVCLELIDEREKLEQFFTTHKAMLKNKTVIFKEVEFWSYSQ
jgi:PII-like signaling protein